MKIQTHHSKIFFYTIAGSSVFFIIFYIFIYTNEVFALNNEQQEALEKTSQIPHIRQTTNGPVEKANILGKAYVIYDINNKKIVAGENSNTPLPIASITKIITVGALLDTAKKNKIEIREETRQRIKKALVQSSNSDADSLGYIYSYSFGKDLLNDSNELIQRLGLTDIKLTNLTGLDNYDGTASNVGSPESLAKMFAFVYENYRDVFEYTKFDEVETTDGTIRNTNKVTGSTFGIMASKTGFTYEAGGNLGVVVSPEPGTAYVIVVMQSTKEGRFEDVRKLANLLPLILKN